MSNRLFYDPKGNYREDGFSPSFIIKNGKTIMFKHPLTLASRSRLSAMSYNPAFTLHLISDGTIVFELRKT